MESQNKPLLNCEEFKTEELKFECYKLKSEELRFEYDKLRQEILQNDSLSFQVLAPILIVIGTIMGFAFSQVITYRPMKGVLFYSSIIIAFFGLLHSIDRAKGTFLIASYLQKFVEPKLSEVRWETRLVSIRKKTFSAINHRLMSLHIWYVIIGWLNWGIGSLYIWREIEQNFESYNQTSLRGFYAVIFISLIGVFTITVFAFQQNTKYITNHTETYGSLWQKVLNDENHAENSNNENLADRYAKPKIEIQGNQTGDGKK
jgi:hypothetical protein